MTTAATMEAPVRTDEADDMCPHSIQFQWGARTQDTQTVRCVFKAGLPWHDPGDPTQHVANRNRDGWAMLNNVPQVLVVASETITWHA